MDKAALSNATTICNATTHFPGGYPGALSRCKRVHQSLIKVSWKGNFNAWRLDLQRNRFICFITCHYISQEYLPVSHVMQQGQYVSHTGANVASLRTDALNDWAFEVREPAKGHLQLKLPAHGFAERFFSRCSSLASHMLKATQTLLELPHDSHCERISTILIHYCNLEIIKSFRIWLVRIGTL